MPVEPSTTRTGVAPARSRTVGTAVLVLALLWALLPQAPSAAQSSGFSDVSADNVHRAAIDALASLEIVVFEGYDDGTFRPGNAITRGQLASVVARILGLQPVVPAGFSDTAGGTHEGSIGALAETGIIRGYADGTFRPGDTVRRDHAATIVARWLGLSPGETGPFADVTGHHAGAVNVLARVDVVQGRTATTFEPLRAVTRAQTASLIHRGLDIAELTAVRFLATNDFHGRLVAPGSSGGAAYLSTHLNAIKDAHPNTLHVDAGDLVGATPVLSNLFYDEPTVEAMNLIGLDIQTVGNHEFDRGRDEIERRAEGGCLDDDCDYRDGTFAGQDFTSLGANVIDTATGEPFLEPYEIIDVGGFDVGFIGVVVENTPNVVHPDGVVGLEFIPEAEAVNEWVPVLEDADVDLIVVLMHEGGRQSGGPNACVDFAGAASTIVPQFDDAVDVVVSGHTHQTYVCDLPDGPLVTSAFQYGQMFTEITLLLDDDGTIVHRMADNRTVTQDVTPDPAIVSLIEDYQELAGPTLREVVGTSEVAIPRTTREAESAQGNLATDALRQQLDDVDFAFQNSGGLRADLTDAEDRDGTLYNIRRENVLEVWPFGNTVWTADVDGPTLKAILDNGVREVGGGRFIQLSGLRIEYSIDDSVDPETNGGFPRGVIETVEYWDHPDHADGAAVDLSASATYRIAMNDFMALGGDGYPVLSDDQVVLRGDALELVIMRYLEDESPVAPAVEGRIVELD